MSEGAGGRAAFSTKVAEVVVAAFFMLLGAIVIYDSVRQGASWGTDGPQPGYFPFYLGLIICAASAITFARALMIPAAKNAAFVETGQLKLVLSVLLPSLVYVGLIGWLGIYVASSLFVAFFMRWLGKYAWWKVLSVSIGNSVVFFLIFEVWFLVPLPKGPLEAWLHIN
ncbi:MAG: tripartite tricarboxylate transporter TctB family protein [Burkholderiales bacterium]